jgi:thioredoxin reductase (NADPH)
MEQIKQFEPGFTLGERAETIDKQEDGVSLSPLIKGHEFMLQLLLLQVVWEVLSLENHYWINFYEDKGLNTLSKPEIQR